MKQIIGSTDPLLTQWTRDIAKEFNLVRQVPIFGSVTTDFVANPSGTTVVTIGLQIPQPGAYATINCSAQFTTANVTSTGLLAYYVKFPSDNASNAGNTLAWQGAPITQFGLAHNRTVQLAPGAQSITVLTKNGTITGAGAAVTGVFNYTVNLFIQTQAAPTH